MIVVGGVYSEYCYHPEWHQIFGSGGRGAAVLTRLGVSDVVLKTCVASSVERSVRATLSPFGVQIDAYPSDHFYEFTYTHPLSEPYLTPYPPIKLDRAPIEADLVLVYGMLEGNPSVSASQVVYDPQSEADILKPSDFIRATERFAIVLNEREVRLLSGEVETIVGATKVMENERASAVIVKQGPFGCAVVDATGVYHVPVYPSSVVFKIGSGDVFSAAFAKFWGIDRMGPVEAAQNASRCTSLYCDTKSIDAVAHFREGGGNTRERRRKPVAYLAGPFFSLSQRFLVEEARRSLMSLGAEVFSPFHEVGVEKPASLIAAEDIQGLEKSTVVLALIPDLDPGTIFEIGFARARNIPVVAYTEGIKEEHLTMLIGSNCICSEDFCSSLYHTVWAGM